MLKTATWLLVVLLVVSGCGNQGVVRDVTGRPIISSRVRAACPAEFPDTYLEALIIATESVRDAGFSVATLIQGLDSERACGQWPSDRQVDCMTCNTIIIDEVYGP